LLISLFFCIANAQDFSYKTLNELSDRELLTYWEEAKSQGLDLNQLTAIAQAKGATATEIDQLQSRIVNLQKNNTAENVSTIDRKAVASSAFGVMSGQKKSEPSSIFGASFFNNPNIQLAPALNIATPSNYQLGPGDEIIIELWGAAAHTYQGALNRDGNISIPELGPVYLNGLSMASGKQKLKQRLSQIYSGINSTIEKEKVFLSFSLLQSRSIIINIIGQVRVPGTYTLNGFTTPLNALYACGGITDLGSYREIELIRNGRVFKTIDLYDYLTKGIPPKTLLRDQDIIRIPFFKTHVEVKGAVKQKKTFELLKGETAADLLNYAGGFTANAFSEALTLERIENMGRRIINIPKTNYDHWTFQNGDVITAKTIGEDFKNRVQLEGAVNISGTYELSEVPTVKQLLQKAGGLSENALKTSALLYRQTDGIETEIISLDLVSVLSAKEEVQLKRNDRLVVLEKNKVTDRHAITVEGEVQNPGVYTHYEGIRLRDALLLSGGLSAAADQSISIFEMEANAAGEFDYVLKHKLNINHELQLTEAQNIHLHPQSVVLVNRNPAVKNIHYAHIIGEVLQPGKFLIKDQNYSVSDLLEQAGGLSSKATSNGVYLLRTVQPGPQEITVDTLDLNTFGDRVRIPIEFKNKEATQINDNSDFPLKEGDQLVVEAYFNTVNINGEVLQETAVGYQKHLKLKHYIQAAGGFSQKAKKNKVFVIAQNGKVSATKSFLGLRSHPALSPGATIYVPQKAERQKKSLQEVLGIATAITTLGLLVNSLVK
jgi:protein involved in polysaccharide export with SLBB domain